MWSFPYLNRPERGQWFTTQQSTVMCYECVRVPLLLKHACVFGKLRSFPCRKSHDFSWVKKYCSCTAHLLRATEGPGLKPKVAVCWATSFHPRSHISSFEMLRKSSQFLFSNVYLKQRDWIQTKVTLILEASQASNS